MKGNEGREHQWTNVELQNESAVSPQVQTPLGAALDMFMNIFYIKGSAEISRIFVLPLSVKIEFLGADLRFHRDEASDNDGPGFMMKECGAPHSMHMNKVN